MKKESHPQKRIAIALAQYQKQLTKISKPQQKTQFVEKKEPKKLKKKKHHHKKKQKPLPKKKLFYKKSKPKPIKKIEKQLKQVKKTQDRSKTQQKVQTTTKTQQKTQLEPLKEAIIVPKKSYQQRYIDKNLAKILALIKEHIYYPRKARRRHIQGEVVLRVVITKDGKIKQMYVKKSSSSVLTYAAKQVMIMIEDKLPKPKEEIVLTIPFEYKLH